MSGFQNVLDNDELKQKSQQICDSILKQLSVCEKCLQKIIAMMIRFHDLRKSELVRRFFIKSPNSLHSNKPIEYNFEIKHPKCPFKN